MLLSLIVSAVVAIQVPSNASSICRDALQMKDVNIPPGSTSTATDIEHVALTYSGNSFAGEIYITRDGDMWYQLGTPRAAVDERTGRSVVNALGFSNQYHQQRFYKIQLGALRALVSAGFSLLSCY